MNFDLPTETRNAILMLLKQNGTETISSLRKKLNISSEGIRLQLVQLERDGFVKRNTERHHSKGGRPALKFSLTTKGEGFFPKQYDALTIEVFDTVANLLGEDAVKKVLSTMTDARVAEWEGRLRGLSLVEKVTALKELYTLDDKFMEMDEQKDEKKIRLIEHNCPFHDIAIKRPVLCNVTLNTLMRLLGYRVVREKRFQNGDGCCVFRIETDQPIEFSTFSYEEEP
jgi:predicted ArsR family transcriptional regulator